MTFSLFSFTVSADDSGGNTGGDDTHGDTTAGNSKFSLLLESLWGYRFSVYFFKDGDLDVSNAKQVGRTVDVVVKGDKASYYRKANAYSLMNVYQRMNNVINGVAVSPAVDENGLLIEYPDNMKKGLGLHGVKLYDDGAYTKEPTVYHHKDNNPLTAFLDSDTAKDIYLIDLYRDNKPEGSYNIFFTGVPEGHISDVPESRQNEIDFTHSAQVVRLCLGDDGIKYIPAYADFLNAEDEDGLIALMEQDFRYGIYRDGVSEGYVKGTYKIYIEPLLFVNYNYTIYAVFTFRDLLAFIPQTKIGAAYDDGTPTNNLGIFGGSYLIQMGQRLHLSYYEPTIHMTGPNKIYEATNSNMKNQSALGKDLFNSAGVGVITGGEMQEEDNPPSVIKMYVYIDSVDENGKITYKKAAPSTIEEAQFVTDSDGNLTLTPEFKNVEYMDGGVAILNDIVSVKDDLDISANSEWLNTPLPTNVGTELQPSALDVAGYTAGIVTQSELFAEDYKEAILVIPNTLNAAIHALSTAKEQSEDLGSEQQHSFITGIDLGLRSSVFLVQTEITEATEYTYYDDIKLGMLEDDGSKVVKIDEETAQEMGVKTPANNLILRYIVKPNPMQINVIEVYDENTGKTTYVNGGTQDLLISDTTVTVQTPDLTGVKDLGTPELVKWVTNSEYPTKDISDGVLPSKSTNGLEGSDKTIKNYPQDPVDHNLYVKWKITIPKKEIEPGKYFVPQWRLSRYFDESMIPDGWAMMSLPISSGCCGLARLSPTGTWHYNVVNPNGNLKQANHTNTKVTTWLHSEAVKKGSAPSITISNPSAVVSIDGVMNAIKSTDTSGLEVASWLNVGSIKSLEAYDIYSGIVGGTISDTEYSKTKLLQFGVYNTDTFVNSWPYGWNSYNNKGEYTGHNHAWIYSNSITPSQAIYTPYSFNAEVFFERYVPSTSRELKVASSVSSSNGETKVSYQTDFILMVFPETAMLFDNDSNESSIQWTIGAMGRVIYPVIYHNMKFDAFVSETSTGSSVATDTRATQKARQLGFAKLQVIYKGAGVNTSFFINKSKGAKEQGTLTVSTYSLDINSNKNGINLKRLWGASSYNPLTYHTDFLSKWNFTSGTITSRLEIDGIKQNYIGANVVKKNAVKMKQETFGGNTYKEYTHELIVRGGEVVGVKVQNRDTLKYTTVQIADLQKKDPELYDALVNMKLIGKNKDETLFKPFEHQTGATLTEQKYADMAANAKKSLDGFETNNISVNKGWYSEDTTALVIKEYVSVFDIPNVAAADKISLSVKGLETPTNKNQFFSTMGKGYNFLNVMFEANLSKIKSDLQNAKVYFEHTSREANDFGDKVVDYLVPNVSVTDSTRLG